MQLFTNKTYSQVYPLYYTFLVLFSSLTLTDLLFCLIVDNFIIVLKESSKINNFMEQPQNHTSHRRSIFKNPLFDRPVAAESPNLESEEREDNPKNVHESTGDHLPESNDSRPHSFHHKHKIFSLEKIGKNRNSTITPFEPIVNRSSRGQSRQKKHKIFQQYPHQKTQKPIQTQPIHKPEYRFTYNTMNTQPQRIYLENKQLPFPLEPTIIKKPVQRVVSQTIQISDSIMTPQEFSHLIMLSRKAQKNRGRHNRVHNIEAKETSRFN